MEATKFLPSSTLPPPHQCSPQVSSLSSRRKLTPRRRPPFVVLMMAASRRSSGSDSKSYGEDPLCRSGKLVDEDMIVLRMWIRETRSEPPSNWMEWEKKYHANNGYDEDVCEAIGLLENYLMNVRPGLALGLVAIVTMSLVLSTGVVLFHAIRIVVTLLYILSGFRFSS